MGKQAAVAAGDSGRVVEDAVGLALPRADIQLSRHRESDAGRRTSFRNC